MDNHGLLVLGLGDSDLSRNILSRWFYGSVFVKMFVRVDMNIFNLINEKYKGNISLLYDKESNYKRLIAYSGDTDF